MAKAISLLLTLVLGLAGILLPGTHVQSVSASRTDAIRAVAMTSTESARSETIVLQEPDIAELLGLLLGSGSIAPDWQDGSVESIEAEGQLYYLDIVENDMSANNESFGTNFPGRANVRVFEGYFLWNERKLPLDEGAADDLRAFFESRAQSPEFQPLI